MKLKILAIACILILPLGLIYAQGNSGSPPSPPGHNSDLDRGQGHVRHEGDTPTQRHQGNGNGHDKFDVSKS